MNFFFGFIAGVASVIALEVVLLIKAVLKDRGGKNGKL